MSEVEIHCSHCFAAITNLQTRGERPMPDEGDVTVCPLCCLISVFVWTVDDGDEDSTITTRTPTEDELKRALERPDVARAVMVADSERQAALEGVKGNGRG